MNEKQKNNNSEWTGWQISEKKNAKMLAVVIGILRIWEEKKDKSIFTIANLIVKAITQLIKMEDK